MHTIPIPAASFSLPVTGRWSVELVTPILSAWRASGLSFVGFCRAHALDATRLQYWVVRERERRRGGVVEKISFTEMRPSASQPLQIYLPRGISLLVPAGIDLGQVRAVVDALL
jgi:hypothetical protein